MNEKREITEVIIFTLLNYKYKWVTVNKLSKESNLPIATVFDFVTNSDLIIRAKNKNSQGEILYSLSNSAKEIYKIEKVKVDDILSKVKSLLLEGKLNQGIEEYFIALKENNKLIPKLMIDVYKNKLLYLVNIYYQIENDWKSKKINPEKKYLEYDKLTYQLHEIIIELELILEEINKHKYKNKNISIKINRNFTDFSSKDSEIVIQNISELLKIDTSKIIVRAIEKGSVIMTLEFEDNNQAEKLFLLIKLGELKEQGIFDARLKELVQSEKKKQELVNEKNRIVQLCKDAKNEIREGKIEKAFSLLNQHLFMIEEEFHNTLILFNSELNFLNKNSNLGIEDIETVKTSRTKLTFSLLNLIDKIVKTTANNTLSSVVH